MQVTRKDQAKEKTFQILCCLKCLMIAKTLFDSFGLCKRKRY